VQGFCKAALREYLRENPPSEAEEEEDEDADGDEGEESEEEDEGDDEEEDSACSLLVSSVLAVVCVPLRVGDEDIGSRMGQAFMKLMGKGSREFVSVDMQQKLSELGLLEHFPTVAWPQMSATCELATRLRKLKKEGQEKAFIAVDLRRFAGARRVSI
jgi:hypothetical protein